MATDKKAEVERRLVQNMGRLTELARYLTAGYAIDADDVLQRTCERVVLRWYQWSGEGFDTWVRAILVSQVREERKSAAIRRTEDIDEVVVSDPVATASMEAVLTRQDITRIWPHLSLAHREVLLLVGLEGYTDAEAAEMLDVPVGTVASRMARARQVAQRLLAETS